MSTRSDWKGAKYGCGCAGLIWLVVLSIIEIPFEALHNGFGTVLGVVLGLTWTVVAISWFGKYGSPSFHEKARWERQEATRLRKKAWKEGRGTSTRAFQRPPSRTIPNPPSTPVSQRPPPSTIPNPPSAPIASALPMQSPQEAPKVISESYEWTYREEASTNDLCRACGHGYLVHHQGAFAGCYECEAGRQEGSQCKGWVLN